VPQLPDHLHGILVHLIKCCLHNARSFSGSLLLPLLSGHLKLGHLKHHHLLALSHLRHHLRQAVVSVAKSVHNGGKYGSNFCKTVALILRLLLHLLV
jgi:hypothetical protein